MRRRPGSAPTSWRNGLRRRGHGVGVAQHRPADGVEDGGAVADRPGDDVLDRPATDRVAVLGTDRVAGPGRLEAEQPAVARRVADRAAEVVGMADRHEAGGDRGSRAAARATGRPVESPWVVGGTEQVALA